MRKAIQRLIQSVGLQVEVFGSAEEFLLSDRSQDAACLLLDVRLPRMSGLDLQRQLINRNPDLPVVLMSGYRDEVSRERALRCGAIDFLQKPFSEEALFAAIDACLHQCRPG